MDCNTCPGGPVIQASIDIGTNTVLLLVAENVSGELHILEDYQRVPRLGQGVDQNHNLSEEAMGRVIKVLVEYQQLLSEKYEKARTPIVIATSAVRDANNRRIFQERVHQETGLSVQILSGIQEAEYTFKGARSMLPAAVRDKPLLTIDIGGGSTEMALGERDQILDCHSFDMGCVRFTERFLSDVETTDEHISSCRNRIQYMLEQHPLDFTPGVILVGVSGTVTSLAYMDQGLYEFENEYIDGYSISRQTIVEFIKWARMASTEEMIDRYPVVMEGRADIFLAGLLILEGIMKRYEFDRITASTGGIRHGAIIAIPRK